MTDRLVLVLGDQLSPATSSLAAADPARDTVLMAEVAEETGYVPHHKKKIAFVLSAMRHFADELAARGWNVVYVRLEDPDNTGSLSGEAVRWARRLGARRIVVTEPGEWRVLRMLDGLEAAAGCAVEILPDRRFIASHAMFRGWAEGRTQLRMEYFYREMRRATGLLMDGDQPVGGRWNFDAENRKPPPGRLLVPEPVRTAPDRTTREVLDLVARRFAGNFGTLEPFWFAVTREDARRVEDAFLDRALPAFGDYQDAMLTDEPFLYHSLLSMYLNVGLLDPLALCRRVEERYRAGRAPLNAAEGYIRQIIGWREFVRGIYWMSMPGYTSRNHLGATLPLPDFYWTGETDMACLRAAIGQTRDEAYAHHIQRLMVTGNFALVAGIDPAAVHEWYLAVYADAFEWVEAPNTIGMSQFADGGLVGSKPYAASGAYIDRMSDYCKGCRYDVKQRTGENACPMNALYWDFLARNEEKLARNPRLAQMYATWRRMAPGVRVDIRASAATFRASLRPWRPPVPAGAAAGSGPSSSAPRPRRAPRPSSR